MARYKCRLLTYLLTYLCQLCYCYYMCHTALIWLEHLLSVSQSNKASLVCTSVHNGLVDSNEIGM